MHFYALFVVVKMRGRPLVNDDAEGPASCKWSSGGAGLLKMMMRRDRPLANDDVEDQPLANGHPEGPAC